GDGATTGSSSWTDFAANDGRGSPRTQTNSRTRADRVRLLREARPRVKFADATGRRRAYLWRRADRDLLLVGESGRFSGTGQAAGGRISDPHRDAPDRRARRSKTSGGLWRLRQAGLLQYALVGDAASVDEDGEIAKGHARSDQNLRPLWAVEV